jgi:hypothetical protein
VYHTAQASTGLNSEWAPWRSLPAPSDGTQNLAVVVGPDRRLPVFKTHGEGQATRAEEVVSGLGAPWRGWRLLSDRENKAKSLVATTGEDGRVHMSGLAWTTGSRTANGWPPSLAGGVCPGRGRRLNATTPVRAPAVAKGAVYAPDPSALSRSSATRGIGRVTARRRSRSFGPSGPFGWLPLV